MKQLALRGRGGVVRALTFVDDKDYEELSQYHWCLSRVGFTAKGWGYAVRNDPHRSGTVRMARQILGLVHGDGLQSDHINGDTLDNRRSNLRVVTCAENMQNRRAYRGSSSRFRGVSWETREGKWRATGRLAGVHKHLGHFDDEVAAAKAAQGWRQEHMPFAQPDPELAKALREAA